MVSTMLLERRYSHEFGEGTDAVAGPPGTWGASVYLQPGELHVGQTPCTLTTIVGSCVAVCMHDSDAQVGGANHYLLPYNLNSGDALRYGSVSIPRLVDELVRRGARKSRLEAKVFGGACMLMTARTRTQHLGAQNVQLAQRLLAEHGIPIVAQDVEGDRARRIFYRTDSGAVWLKRL